MYRSHVLGMSTDVIKKEIAHINGVAESEIAKLIGVLMLFSGKMLQERERILHH